MVIYKFRNLNTSQATPIPPGAYTVGRDDDSDVQVLDSSVSRHHAKIYNEGDGLYLEDAGSANGTSAHGTRITSRVKLNFGDMVNIGSVPFRIDPEVTAEGSSGPLPGMRSTGHTSITRPTERLPSPPVPGQAGTPVSLGNLPAREGNQVTDKATKTPGITTAVAPMAPPVRLPTAWPGTSGPPPENGPRPVSVPSTLTGTPGITAVPRIKKEPSPPAPGRSPQAVVPVIAAPPKVSPPIRESAPQVVPAGNKWLWTALIFLAGLGVGLLLGLIFAKIFIEMGGKMGALP